MSTNNGDAASSSTAPGQASMGAGWIVLVALYLIFSSVLVLYGLLKLWPHPTPSGEPKVQGQASASTRPVDPTATSPTLPQASSPVVGAVVPPPRRSPSVVSTPAPTPAPSGTASVTPSPTPNSNIELPDPEFISFFGGRIDAKVHAETRLLLLVMLSGALGSLMHSLRSLYWYTGNRLMVWSWVGFYVILPFTGAILSVIFYFVVRGGFFSPQASFETTSPFGFAALSALVGLFSPQATLKLKEVAETIFTKPAAGTDNKPQGSVPQSSDAGAGTAAPTISLVTPHSGSATGGEKAVITGTDFTSGVAVKFGDLPAEVTSSSSTSVEVVTPASASGPGVVDVEVKNPDGQKATLSEGYTYLAGGA